MLGVYVLPKDWFHVLKKAFEECQVSVRQVYNSSQQVENNCQTSVQQVYRKCPKSGQYVL